MTALRWHLRVGVSQLGNIARIAIKAPFTFHNWLYFLGSRYQRKEGILRLRNGINFVIRPDSTDRSSISDVFAVGNYPPVPNGSVVVEVGANIGAFAIPAARRAQVVYAIEPVRANFELLVRNIELNGTGNVRPYRLALRDRNGTSPITREGMAGSFHFRNPTSQTEEVPTSTLETFLNENHIDRVDYLKMDCEGAEWEIILSTPPAVLARIDQIEMEFHNIGNETHPAQLRDHLAKAGFVTTYTDPNSFNGALQSNRTCQEQACKAAAA